MYFMLFAIRIIDWKWKILIFAVVVAYCDTIKVQIRTKRGKVNIQSPVINERK